MEYPPGFRRSDRVTVGQLQYCLETGLLFVSCLAFASLGLWIDLLWCPEAFSSSDLWTSGGEMLGFLLGGVWYLLRSMRHRVKMSCLSGTFYISGWTLTHFLPQVDADHSGVWLISVLYVMFDGSVSGHFFGGGALGRLHSCQLCRCMSISFQKNAALQHGVGG